ncbi:MAG: glycosyltransferase family 39 protein [Candidatus Omnitrophota bacterium]
MKDKHLLLILLWAGAILIFAYSWMPGGMDVDSCHYAVVSKGILESGKWLGFFDPIIRETFFYHFPLVLWVTALFFKLLGVSVFSATLFSMLCGFILTAVIFYFGRLLKNQWVGFFGGLSFLLTNHIVRITRKCRMDIPVSLFITLAMFSFILAQKRRRLYYLWFGLFSCLAIFTKDISGTAPLVIAVLYLLFCKKWRELINPLFLSGILLALLPAAVWIWLDHMALFKLWLNCNFLHLWQTVSIKIRWYYYIEVLFTKYVYFLPLALYGGYLAIKHARKDKQPEFLILIIWAVFFPFVFSFGRQKLHYFILPIYPAASLLVGLACDKLFRERLKERIAESFKYLFAFAAIVMLSFPLPVGGRRFSEIVRLAPAMDELLKQVVEYEFIVYRQDQASILWYSRQLRRISLIEDIPALEKELSQGQTKPRFCYIAEEDYALINPEIRNTCRVLLKYKNRLVIINQKGPALIVNIV